MNGNVQIVNMNLNYIDERFAKVLTKIYTKLFFDFATSLNDRASYPIHIQSELHTQKLATTQSLPRYSQSALYSNLLFNLRKDG